MMQMKPVPRFFEEEIQVAVVMLGNARRQIARNSRFGVTVHKRGLAESANRVASANSVKRTPSRRQEQVQAAKFVAAPDWAANRCDSAAGFCPVASRLGDVIY
jgi:hypothetical protein